MPKAIICDNFLELAAGYYGSIIQTARVRAHYQKCVSCRRATDYSLAHRFIVQSPDALAKLANFERCDIECFSPDTFTDYWLNELSSQERKVVKKHLVDGCIGCRKTSKEARKIAEQVREELRE